MSKLDWSKLDCEDGINEEWWNKEMAKPIPELKPITKRPRALDLEAWDLHTKDAHGNESSDPQVQFWGDAHNLLCALKYVLADQKALGLLHQVTESVLKVALEVMESEFQPDHQGERPF